jgi:hypothetical protein
MEKAKVITIRQPWAQLIVQGDKEFETRSFNTPYRGELFIHAAKSFSFNDVELCHQDKYFKECIPDHTKLKTGFIIGKVQLVDCVPTHLCSCISYQERAFGDFSNGRWAWRLSSPVLFDKPIEALGKQGFWYHDVEGKEAVHG